MMKKKINDYSRRDFLKLAGSVALVSALQPTLANIPISNPVANEAAREQYAIRLLKQLCTDIGVRSTGTPQYAQAAKILKAEMERSLPVVGYDKYLFEGWELVDTPEFFIGNQYIEAWPAFGSPDVPSSGITGIIEKQEVGYALVDPVSKKLKMHITINSYGKAMSTHYKGWGKERYLPTVRIGRQDIPLIQRAVKHQIEARMKMQVRFLPNETGINIVGQLPGRTTDEILIIAHADTPYNSPGAIDNTSSVIVMLMLAHELAGSKPKHTITFLATDAEEYGYLGAKNYAQKRAADGTIKNIKHVINFDSVAWGPNLWFNSFDEELKTILSTIHTDLNLNTTPRFEHSDGFVMDSSPFRESGARAVHVNSRGYDEKTLPLYHRPDDNADNLPLDCLEIAFQVFRSYVRHIDKL